MNRALLSEINSVIYKNYRKVTNEIKAKIPNWVMEQPEVKSLGQEGQLSSLNAQFGLHIGSSAAAIQSIASAVANSTTVKITKINERFKGGVEFSIQPTNFANLLGLPEGFVITSAGTKLHWLAWLLQAGSSVIVTGYEYTPSFEGRSGGGIMTGGGVWRVPPQFAGTESDNFITRALSNRDKELAILLKGLLNV